MRQENLDNDLRKVLEKLLNKLQFYYRVLGLSYVRE